MTRAELQRVEERRHVESVLRNARRVRLPKKKAGPIKHDDPVTIARVVPTQPETRPLTPAEQERIEERRHVESVMRNARRSRLRLRKKPAAVRSGDGGSGAGKLEAATESSTPATMIRRHATTLAVVAVALGCALLVLSLETVFQHNRLAEDLVALREETSLLKDKQQESLDKIEQALLQVAAAEDKVEARLQAVTDSQGKLESKVGALEAGRTEETARWQESLSGIEKATREGLAEVAARLDSEEALGASVEKLLPLLPQPSSPSATVEVPPDTTPAP